MIQALKLGFSHSIPRRVYAVNYCRIPKFSTPFCLNLGMAPKRRRSSTAASSIKDSSVEASIDEAELRRNASKTSNSENEGGEDECDMFEKMPLQEIKSRLRSNGVSVKGSKDELISALKSTMSSKTDGDGSSAVTKRNSKRKGEGSPEDEPIEATPNASDVSRAKRTKRQVKQSSKDSIDISISQSRTEQELIIESTETEEGKKSTQVKRKVSSRITSTKAKASVSVSVSVDEPWTVLTHKKPQKGWTGYDPKTMRPPPIDSDTPHIKLMSWNVNGLRALLKLESFSALQLAQRENFDVLCLQETKLQEKDVEAIRETLLEGYDNSYRTCSVAKLGYSGTAIISRIKPISVKYGLGITDHDSEGRLVTVEFDNFYLLSCYVPNSGDGLKRLDLEKSKPVILTGDLNCAHEEIDIFNPAGNKRSAGFTEEERKSFETNFLDRGLVDTFRRQHPNVVAYSYWGYRHGGRRTNKGWRLDYFLASESIADRVHDSYILPDVGGSDHSPVGLILKL